MANLGHISVPIAAALFYRPRCRHVAIASFINSHSFSHEVFLRVQNGKRPFRICVRRQARLRRDYGFSHATPIIRRLAISFALAICKTISTARAI